MVKGIKANGRILKETGWERLYTLMGQRKKEYGMMKIMRNGLID